MSDDTDRGYVFGLEVDGLGDHITPLETVTLIKALDEDGDPALFLRSTDDTSSWEALGMLEAAADQHRLTLRESWRDSDEED